MIRSPSASEPPQCSDDTFGPWAGPTCRGGFDFSLFFEEAVLAVPLDLIFLVSAAWAVQRHRRYSIKVENSKLNRVHGLFKLAITSCVIMLRLVLFVLWTGSSPGPRATAPTSTPASVPAAALSFTASLAHLLLSWREHTRTVRPSFEIEVYLFLTTLLSLPRARTLWMMVVSSKGGSVRIPATFTASLWLQVVGIVCESWEKRRLLRRSFSSWPGESLAGTLNRSLFCWLCPILLKGNKQILSLSDLPPLDPKLEAKKLEVGFVEAWYTVPDKSKAGALLMTWCNAHLKFILAGVIPRLFQIAFRFSQPWLVEAAIAFASTPDKPEYNNTGYGLIGAYVLVYTGIAISTGQYQWRVVRTAAYMRGALVPVIARKTLRIDLAQTASASALTLITTDIETIDGGIKNVHELWAAPVEIGLGAYLLYRQIGPAMGIPLGVAFVALFIALFMAAPVGVKLSSWIKASEVRVAATSHTLGNVKSYRMAGLNSVAFAAMEQLRSRELQVSRTYRLWFCAATILPLCLASLNPVLSFAGFIGVSSGSDSLSISQALTSLSVLALLHRPLSNLSVALTSLAGAVTSFDRIQQYLNVAEQENKRIWSLPPVRPSFDARSDITLQPPTGATTNDSEDSDGNTTADSETTFAEAEIFLPTETFVFIDGTLTWPGSERPTLDIHELTIPSSCVTVLLGPTGCGKTTLLSTILGEVVSFEGSIRVSSLDASYCAQKPWLPGGTIREAIVAGSELDMDWYSQTLHACALLPDLAALPEGDQSLLGNKGTSLSGGQRQRIAIARAVYARRQLALFDDVFKSLDGTTSNIVMHNLFGPYGLLRGIGVTSIVSSSESYCVRYADYVVTMSSEGKIASCGTPLEQGVNTDTSSYTQQDLQEVSFSRTTMDIEQKVEGTLEDGEGDEAKEDTVLQKNDRARQEGDASIHRYYARAAGWRSVASFVSALAVAASADAFSQIWVVWWAEATTANPMVSNGKWLGTYSALCLIHMMANLVAGWEIFITVITKTGLHFHSLLVETVSRAPMSFFQTVDPGVTVNRFSQDLQLIDMELPGCALGAAMAFATVIGQAVVIGVTARYVAVAFPLLILVFYLLQRFYLRTSRQMRLLAIEHTAPLYTHVIEMLDGLASIRAFGLEDRCTEAMRHSLDDSQRPSYLLACLQQWLLFSSDMIVAALAVILITVTTTLRHQIGVGFMGLALSNVVAFGTTVQMLLVAWVQLEISIGAIARIREFSTLIQRETFNETPMGPPAPNWPSQGHVTFCNVSVSYPGAGQVLHNISFHIPPRSKVGICGRTGSGKSSLALSLFRLVDLTGGSIFIDGVDISTVPPDVLRDSIVGLPQDFLTLNDTLRRNVDPQATRPDGEIIEILKRARLWKVVEPRGGLDMMVGQDVLSYGELQLLAFARVMARRSTILVLDEMTSNMDEANSAVVDELIRTEFRDWTILSVAHKLESIRHYDRILVLDAGRIVECDSPDRLLANPSSFFRKLYEDTTQRQA